MRSGLRAAKLYADDLADHHLTYRARLLPFLKPRVAVDP